MEKLEALRVRLPGVPDALLSALLDDAAGTICAYTNRRSVPVALEGVQVRLSVIYYNRMGTEGETSHGEGGVSRGMESLPLDIEKAMRPHRLAKVITMSRAGDANAPA